MKFFWTLRVGAWMCLVFLTTTECIRSQDARYFRVTGPVSAKMVGVSASGSVIWTNSVTNATFTIQAATNLNGLSNWVDYAQVIASNPITTNLTFHLHPPLNMVFIPAGSFTMGDCTDSNAYFASPVHTVSVSPFFMDKFDVTKALWDEVYIWANAHGYSFTNAGSGKQTNHPVQTVNWYDCVKWCNARSEKEGKTPAYYTSAAQTTVYRTGQIDLDAGSVKWNTGYRLPTEAEWEKAARGGAIGKKFPWGNTISQNDANFYSYWSCSICLPHPWNPYEISPGGNGYAYVSGSGEPYTSPVGHYAPNGYGLYDMAGNVEQMCWDWFATSYESASPQTDPHGPTSGSSRVTRGGNWRRPGQVTGGGDYVRVASRSYNDPTFPYYAYGFRTVLPVVP